MGLILIPSVPGMILIRPLSGRLSERYGWKIFNVGGPALSAGGVFLLPRLTETSTLSRLMTGTIFQSSGMATFGSPNQSSVFQRSGTAEAPNCLGVFKPDAILHQFHQHRLGYGHCEGNHGC